VQDGGEEPADGADLREQWALSVGIREAVCVRGHGRNDGHLHHPAPGLFQGTNSRTWPMLVFAVPVKSFGFRVC
jgi:hypothetical protein